MSVIRFSFLFSLGALLLFSLGIDVGGRERPDPNHPPEAPRGFHWEKVAQLSDEFNGIQLDSSKWAPSHPYFSGLPPGQYSESNVSLDGGNLKLRSTTNLDSLSEIKDPKKDRWVTSACVSSKEPSASYGYYSARIKASSLSMSSSFWFQGKYSEIDVAEQFGAPLNNSSRSHMMYMTTHFFRDGWAADKSQQVRWIMPTPAADGFHVYGMWWKDATLVFFYHDGVEVGHISLNQEFTEPMYLFLDAEVFAGIGLPSISSLKNENKNTMKVDWVRSWKLQRN